VVSQAPPPRSNPVNPAPPVTTTFLEPIIKHPSNIRETGSCITLFGKSLSRYFKENPAGSKKPSAKGAAYLQSYEHQKTSHPPQHDFNILCVCYMCTPYIIMASKTISLSEEAYEQLKSKKQKGESFSTVIKRLVKKRPLTAFAGAWRDLEEEKITEIKNILKREKEISLEEKRSRME